jgi:hypothetical protein
MVDSDVVEDHIALYDDKYEDEDQWQESAKEDI